MEIKFEGEEGGREGKIREGKVGRNNNEDITRLSFISHLIAHSKPENPTKRFKIPTICTISMPNSLITNLKIL